jgi:hypothetical protein
MPKESNFQRYNKEDDFLHAPDEREKWRESYYFNWVDLDNQISGFTTLGILPNEEKRELVFILFFKNKRMVYYKEPQLENYNHEVNPNSVLKDKNLCYKMIKPMEEWKILHSSRKYKFEISFKNRFSPYYFGKDSSASWHRHFECSGYVSGSLLLRNGKELDVKGFGQRDKSWGYRDWHQFDKWYAGHFQFNKWSCGFRKDYQNNHMQLSGYIGTEQGNIALKKIDIQVKNDTDAFNSPLTTIYNIKDINNNQYQIQATRINKSSFMRFSREFDEGSTELFEQMVVIKDLESGEIGAGMSEELRTHWSK